MVNDKLIEWIITYPSARKAAQSIGLNSSTLSLWMKGKRGPNSTNCRKIEAISKGRFKAKEIRPDLFKDENNED